MKMDEIMIMGEGFQAVHVHKFHPLYMLKRVIKNRILLKIFKVMDSILFRILPFLKRYCGEWVIELVK